MSVIAIYYGVILVVPLAIIPLILLRRLHWTRLARAADRDGVGNVVHGVVEADASPVVIEIDQHGRKPQGSGAIEWRETARRITAKPFALRLAGGERVDVVPDDRVVLVMKRTAAEREHLERTMTATVTPGSSVHVAGVLARGGEPYRGNATLAGVLTISPDPLRERFDEHAEYLASKAIGLAFLTAAANLLLPRAWEADIGTLGTVGAWIVHHGTIVKVVRWIVGLGCAGLGKIYFFADKPWYEMDRVRESGEA